MATYTSGDWYVMPGHEQDFVSTWKDFAERTNQRFGGGWAMLLHDKDDPTHFTSVGMWSDEQRVQEWRESDDFRAGMESMRAYLEKMQLHTFEHAASSGRVEAHV